MREGDFRNSRIRHISGAPHDFNDSQDDDHRFLPRISLIIPYNHIRSVIDRKEEEEH